MTEGRRAGGSRVGHVEPLAHRTARSTGRSNSHICAWSYRVWRRATVAPVLLTAACATHAPHVAGVTCLVGGRIEGAVLLTLCRGRETRGPQPLGCHVLLWVHRLVLHKELNKVELHPLLHADILAQLIQKLVGKSLVHLRSVRWWGRRSVRWPDILQRQRRCHGRCWRAGRRLSVLH